MIGPALFALAGLLLGLAHFAVLRWTVAAYLHGTRAAIAWYVVRLAASAAALVALARLGGRLVLATLVGFVAARAIAVRLARSRQEAP